MTAKLHSPWTHPPFCLSSFFVSVFSSSSPSQSLCRYRRGPFSIRAAGVALNGLAVSVLFPHVFLSLRGWQAPLPYRLVFLLFHVFSLFCLLLFLFSYLGEPPDSPRPPPRAFMSLPSPLLSSLPGGRFLSHPQACFARRDPSKYAENKERDGKREGGRKKREGRKEDGGWMSSDKLGWYGRE